MVVNNRLYNTQNRKKCCSRKFIILKASSIKFKVILVLFFHKVRSYVGTKSFISSDLDLRSLIIFQVSVPEEVAKVDFWVEAMERVALVDLLVEASEVHQVETI